MEVHHYPKKRATKFDARCGETRAMKCGMTAQIIEYYHRHDITVKFLDGTIVYKRTYTAFCNGDIDPKHVAKKYRIELEA